MVQVQTKGHKQHLAHCTGKPRRPVRQEEAEDLAEDEEDEEELAEVQVSKVTHCWPKPSLAVISESVFDKVHSKNRKMLRAEFWCRRLRECSRWMTS